MPYPFLGLGFNSWTQKFGRSAATAALKLIVGAKFQDFYKGAVFIYDASDLNSAPIKVNASDTSAFDYFSISLAIGNSKIAAGMPLSDDNGSSSGSAFIFDLDGTNEVKLNASDAAANDRFGTSVAIGNSKVAVGAEYSPSGNQNGAVYVYNLDGSGEVKITASDTANQDFFGTAVAIANNKLYVGASRDDDGGGNTGSVYIYNLDGSGESKITASDAAANALFGCSLATGHDKLVVGAEGGNGAVYVYDLDGSNEVKITASDGASGDSFGGAVAIGSNKIVVGAIGDDDDGSGSGSAYVFNLDGTGQVKITASDAAASDNFGSAVAVGGDKVYVGAMFEDEAGSNSGAAYVFNLDGTGEVKIPSPAPAGATENFGESMALGS